MTPRNALAEMFGLTDRQAEVLGAIMDYRHKHGRTPSYLDLGKIIGCSSSNAVKGHLTYLAKKGAISIEPFKARTAVPRVRFIAMKEKEPGACNRPLAQ